MASQRSTSARPAPEPTNPPLPEATSPRRPGLSMFQSAESTFQSAESTEANRELRHLIGAEDWGSPDPEPSDPLEQSDAPPTSSKASSVSATSKRAVRDAARQAVLMAGGVAHQVLARDEAARTVDLYLADEADAEAIGDPVANMVNRRGGIGAAGNPDLADAIAALIGLALYVIKQLTRWAIAKDLRASSGHSLAEPGSVPDGDADTTPAPFGPQGG